MPYQINRGSPSNILEHRIKSVVVVVSTCCNRGYGLVVTFFCGLLLCAGAKMESMRLRVICKAYMSLWDKSSISRATSRVNRDSLAITSDVQSMISCVSISLDSIILWACAGSRFWYKTSDIFSVYMVLYADNFSQDTK